MIIAVFLIVLGVVLTLKNASAKKKKGTITETEPIRLSEGETLNNSYIIRHEKKLKDDAEYEEYLEWCKFKGELPEEKEGFDAHRSQEYLMYKKLLKHGIGGI